MYYNPFSLEGRTVIVTGASSGIGRQCAIDCSMMGASVIMIARNAERLAETAEKLHGKYKIYQYDLSELNGIKGLVETIVADCGPIDGYIHSAGIEKTMPVKYLTYKDYRALYDVNAISAFEFIRQFYSRKYFSDEGHIVLISSITSVVGRGGVSAYAASKGAIVSAVKSMALELAKRKIGINCVSPGTILTPMMQTFLDTLSTDEYKRRIDGFPLGLGHETDISQTCVFLLSDASKWMTGQNIIVDGGYTVH